MKYVERDSRYGRVHFDTPDEVRVHIVSLAAHLAAVISKPTTEAIAFSEDSKGVIITALNLLIRTETGHVSSPKEGRD